MTRRAHVVLVSVALALVGCAGFLQARLEANRPVHALETGELYLRSPKVLDRAVLSYDALVADVYWMRAIQHFGDQRLIESADKRFDLLYPLLDLTTALDPYFTAAYYLGSFFLAEPRPGGAGRPDLGVTLLMRALQYQPDSWRLAQQVGFIHYWYQNDFLKAAEWFRRASAMSEAPPWVRALEASMYAEGGDLETSRRVWRQIIETSDSDWMRDTARYRLAQIETFASIDMLERIVTEHALAHGYPPATWNDLIRAGRIRGIPVDATGIPFVLEDLGNVDVSPQSPLYPLPTRLVPGAS